MNSKILRWAIIISIIIIGLGIYFVQFTALGYRMTVSLRDFQELDDNIYVYNSYGIDDKTILEVISEAKKRVRNFYGGLQSSPVIILSDDKKVLDKLNGDHDIMTAVFGNVYSYISVSSEYFDVDILAHEMTHAETHARLYKGKIWYSAIVPVWFDEGIALQNDYREQYSEETWVEKTDNGTNIISLDEMDTSEEFYKGTKEDRRFRYMLSRHELKNWIEKKNVDSVNELLERVNQGEDFDTMYFGYWS
ncbi:hypothetical protein Curi_c12810 [Gottschalkia acidurici 9a]|uniref:Peptidase MA-like domain-containing protein n=1 Tax=Gottschalkia acidurici (strain ATCC 7906 / DSM 604 / BCRC 14475 / CIP 104303 / KCTC 5404 / NCIMB 10678 / 9a) TaxID=1128398 RepID=K0AZT1_GOTA9|nr:hypothetical protein [Gottschalkia acidurici]AFS78292.1 hypothetical protein Curi_c12810 [Gottschalkia acidurici 9a]